MSQIHHVTEMRVSPLWVERKFCLFFQGRLGVSLRSRHSPGCVWRPHQTGGTPRSGLPLSPVRLGETGLPRRRSSSPTLRSEGSWTTRIGPTYGTGGRDDWRTDRVSQRGREDHRLTRVVRVWEEGPETYRHGEVTSSISIEVEVLSREPDVLGRVRVSGVTFHLFH